ncbi:MAG: hypothetical protein ACRD82_18670, partial [Blastocatellia bacterium]
ALSLANRGQVGEAAKSLSNVFASLPSNQLKLLRALLLKRAGQEREALGGFVGSLVPLSDSLAMTAFNSGEDELRWQFARLYARLGQPRAALKVAAVDERLRGSATVSVGEELLQTATPKFQTLAARTAERQNKSRLELLALLSTAAEQIGDFDKAADFERARLAGLNADERRKTETRVEQLKARQKETTSKRGLPLTIDDRPVGVR